ncbi:helicase-associated domain-containing protein [Knoellia aerolata]|uniref:SAP domain-containing protein n=1 Tax=Knoellia aerolata DSM 18566 TaxID=1385519 RepID=A0A0A0K1X9_9MICO|nr:helicase-associated domain-containing protein [Knoellia aerolata]KGN41801.1 hypothetical protein N801_04540 [Knoellia aerolata DSM 18566]
MNAFVSWLARLDQRDLATVLGNRADVLHGTPPDDLTAVARRLATRRSLASALVASPKPALQVLTALLILGGDAPLARIAAMLDAGPSPADHLTKVGHWCRVLEASALVWLDEQHVHAAPGISDVLALPEGTGTPSRRLLDALTVAVLRLILQIWRLPWNGTKAELVDRLGAAFGDPVAVRERVGRLTDEQRDALLAEIDSHDAESDPALHRRRLTGLADAVRAGAEAGIVLTGYTPYEFSVPAEVVVVLRGHGLPFDRHEPVPPTSEASPHMVARESAAALQTFAEASITILDHVRDRPLTPLRHGGIGAREVSRVGKVCRIESQMVRLVLDLAYAAQLLVWDHTGYAWGESTREWRDLDAGTRTVTLLRAWPFLGWSPTLARGLDGSALAVGDSERACDRCTDARMSTLAEWLRIADGQGVTDSAMGELMTWLRPLDHFEHRALVVEEVSSATYRHRWGRTVTRTLPDPLWLVEVEPSLGVIAEEARMLGLVAHGAATAVLRELFGAPTGGSPDGTQNGPQDAETGLVRLVGSLLPQPVAQATFGSDLTAVVTGPPTGELSALLDSCADREGRGGAATWRFSTASVRRALDAGARAEDLETRLSAVSRGTLPQPLTYLLADVSRRHGSVRVFDGRAVLRSEDVELLAQIVADRKLRKLGLLSVVPTVAVATVASGEVLKALRAAGYLPMAGAGPGNGTDESVEGTNDRPGANPRQELDAMLRRLAAEDVMDLDALLPAHPARHEPETPEVAAARLAGR